MAKYIFGIDLGTTYSCIAYVDETSRATIVNNQEGTPTTPSVVNFTDPNLVVVGQVAKETAVIEPDSTVSLVKTLMGKTNFSHTYNGSDLSPEEVSAYILRKLANDCGEMLNTEVKDVVITCPAYFGTAERTATKNAGTIAGLNVIEIISEPTAAALYYGCTKAEGSRTVLVYDLGGGTFDVTVMRIEPGEIKVICSDGNHELGGKDWDSAIMNYLEEEFKKSTGMEGDFDNYAQQDLRLKAEKAKQQLTAKEEVKVMLDAAGLHGRVELSRATFEEITEVLMEESLDRTDACIEIAKEKGYEIDEILLVGGSTKMPQVKRGVEERYKIETKVLEPDEAVAKGAAIYALGAYEGKVTEWQEKIAAGEVDLTDEKVKEEVECYKEAAAVSTATIPGIKGSKIGEVVTVAATKSYALEVLVPDETGEKTEKCCNMIIKNSLLENGAVSETKQFGTTDPNQTMATLVVYETDFSDLYFDVDPDFVLGEAELELPGNLPAGSPLEVTFTLNKEGILEVNGKDLTSGAIINATMQSSSGTTMSLEDVAEAKEKSKKISVE